MYIFNKPLRPIITIFLFGCLCLTTSLYGQSTFTLSVAGNCGMCEANILDAANATPGVLSAEYSLDDRLLKVETDENTFDQALLAANLSKAGYDNGLAEADQTVYDGLASCCQYRRFDEYDADLYALGTLPDYDIQFPSTSVELSPFISGTIYGQIDASNAEPLIGATINYVDRTAGATSDLDGKFEIGRIDGATLLEISYVGFQTDTVDISQINTFEHILSNGEMMDEVVITYRGGTTTISHIKPIQTHVVTEEELCKAACCSLSESFETSPSIDVSFTDAVTGTRQIQMLGLAGKYVQISRELIPDVRSIGAINGLKLTPGPWISSIQLSKGVGSVVNGFESMTGQINLELRKPEKEERLFLNLYGNGSGRYEGNLFFRHEFNENISTSFLIHGNDRQRRFDRNNDGFLDNILNRGFIGINRWKYQHANGLQAQLGVKLSSSNAVGGQVEFLPHLSDSSDQFWGVQKEEEKLELWTKVGKVFNEAKNNSLGFQFAFVDHQDESEYGTKFYGSDHQSIYANLIYQTNIQSPSNSVKFGLSYQQDNIDEELLQPLETGIDPAQSRDLFSRVEQVPGAFVEYTYLPTSDVTLVGGLRLDHHNQYGTIFTPRLHLRYAVNDNTVLRGIAGRGWRTANPLSENPGIFANNRRISIQGDDVADTPYGLQREQSWNFGGNITQTLPFTRVATLSVDYYYTLFDNQIIADFESNLTGTIILTDQIDRTSGHSAQAQLDVELLKNFDVRVAYRFNRNEAFFGEQLLTTAFNPFHKAFINLAYETESKWYFDATLNWRGEQRIPDTAWLGDGNRLADRTPSYFIANAQIRKFLSDDFEVYVGAENFLNFTQDNPIIGSDNPFGRNFDASYIYAPIFGRTTYVGLRYKLPYQ